MRLNNEQFEAHVYDLIRKHQIASNELDEKQLAEAFKQALMAGDFQKYVRASDDAQTIVYIPFNEVERMDSEISRLKQILEANGIDYSPTGLD